MLNTKIQRKIKRLENTIRCTNTILLEINGNLRTVIQENEKIIVLANVYRRWKEKVSAINKK